MTRLVNNKTTLNILKFGSLIAISNALGGILGYFYQVIMARMLDQSDFGLFISLMSLASIVASPFSAMSLYLTRSVSYSYALNDFSAIEEKFAFCIGQFSLLSVFILIISSAASNGLIQFLSVPNYESILIVCLMTVAFGYLSISNSFLQAFNNYSWMAANSVAGVLLKTIFGALLIFFNFGVLGALCGVFTSTILLFIVSLYLLKLHFVPNIRLFDTRYHILSKFKALLPLVVAVSCFSLMTQIDVLLANKFFSSHDSANYAAASVLGKSVLYLPSGFVVALYPIVASDFARKIDTLNSLIATLKVTFIISILPSMIFYFFSNEIIWLFYGEKYADSAAILKWYGFSMVPMCLVLVIENFLIAHRKILMTWVFIFLLPFQLLAYYFYHQNPGQLIAIVAVSGSLLVLISSLLFNKILKEKSIK